MEQRDQSEWRINSFWMKLLFVIAVVWGVINTLFFLYGFIIGMAGA